MLDKVNPSSIVAEATSRIMKGLDHLFTSDDERNKVRAEIEDGVNSVFTAMLAFVQRQEGERTKRHENDMNSDSWLSKNIRPLTLGTLILALLTYVVWDSSPSAYLLDPVTGELVKDAAGNLVLEPKFTVDERWIELLSSLLEVVVGFYFVSRGVQACTQSYARMKERIAASQAAL